jgi:hypothetical protein
MYCSTCGKPVTAGLSYCNHCGARLGGGKSAGANQTELFPESLVWAIVSVFVVGLGGTIGLMAVMKDAAFQPGVIISLTLLSFALMLAVEGVLVWLLLGRRKSEKVSAKQEAKAQLEATATRELGVVETRALPEPVASVTDHTTRTLEPVYRERKAD